MSDIIPDEYTRSQARQFVLNDFCQHDCAGYRATHSPRYRRTYARALGGDPRALRTVLLDRDCHSGDNESWENIPGQLLYVVGDARFDRLLATLPEKDQRYVLTYIRNAGFFHVAEAERGEHGFFALHFPRTHRRYARFFPKYAND